MEKELIKALEKLMELVSHDRLFPLLHKQKQEIAPEARKTLNQAQRLALKN